MQCKLLLIEGLVLKQIALFFSFQEVKYYKLKVLNIKLNSIYFDCFGILYISSERDINYYKKNVINVQIAVAHGKYQVFRKQT